MLSRALNSSKNVLRTAVRQYHADGGVPGENLPFSFSNRIRFTIITTIFAATGIGAPFFVLRHQLLKK